jgi:2-polyprenyl-3-methyl-5-hydroxy-6-metoxy-1,4-benzoquinol methylase
MTTPDAERFDIRGYWEQRLREHPDVTGVGGAGLPPRFGALMYHARMREMARSLRRCGAQDLRGAAILDVGSGTGIWLNFWRERGARLTAIDFAEASVVALRSAFPDATIVQADISDERPPLPSDSSFDLVSACEVFLHVLDATGLDHAVGHLASLCAPGGLLIISDPIVSGTGYTPMRSTARYLRVRSASEYCSALARHGFTVESVRPATVLLNSPLEAPNKAMYLLLRRWWWICVRSARWWAQSAILTALVGRALLLTDQLACRIWTHGATPTSKLIIARRS